MNCECGNKFFIEHKNVITFIGKDNFYFHLFHKHPSLDLKYSIFECSICRRMYICKKYYDEDKIEKLIPVEEFNLDDASEFSTRAHLLTSYLHFNDILISNMVRVV
jgi:hypothetical protein